MSTAHAASGRRRVALPWRRRPRVRSTALHVVGIAVTSVSIGMLVGALVEWGSTDRDTAALFSAAGLTAVVGGVLWWSTEPGNVRSRDVFAAVGWSWVSVTVIGATPYALAGTFDVAGMDTSAQLVNAVFESASGFSCTGSTALTDFGHPGRGTLMYRQITQWYGGMGVVVLAVAVLPFLGVGGLDLMAAEAPGPDSDRLTPRISETAKRLWFTYALFTAALVAALIVVPGPSVYDAFAHAFTIASTGGFSPYADSIAYFDSVTVELVMIAGMVIGGANFALHWRALTGRRRVYRSDAEFRGYLAVLVSAVGVVSALLVLEDGFGIFSALRYGAFAVVSLGTSTGFHNSAAPGTHGDFVFWAPAAQLVLLGLMVVGACTGSTSGGVKIMRAQVLRAQSIRSIRRTQHPRAVIPIKHGRSAVAEDIVTRVTGFFVLYALLVLVGVILVTALSGGLVESIGAIVGSLGNMGPALGDAGPTANFSDAFTEPARLVLALYMIIGRLEIFPILLMFAAPLRLVADRPG